MSVPVKVSVCCEPRGCLGDFERMVARPLGQAARRRAAASDRAALDVFGRLPVVKWHAATVMRRAVRLALALLLCQPESACAGSVELRLAADALVAVRCKMGG